MRRLPSTTLFFVIVSGILICATTILPSIYVLYTGLRDEQPGGFTIHYYHKVMNDPVFRASCMNTFLFSSGYAVLQIVLAFAVGKAVVRSDRTVRTIFLVVLMVPWVISEMASVIMWRWLFMAEVGPFDQFASWLGLGHPSIMIYTSGARLALLIAALWRGFAFSTVFAIGVYASIPNILYHAASIEDLGWWRTIRAVELPVIRPAALMMAIVLAIQTINQFTLSARLTNGGPAHATTLISNYIYELLISESHQGYSAAAGSMLFFAVVCGVALYSLARRIIHP